MGLHSGAARVLWYLSGLVLALGSPVDDIPVAEKYVIPVQVAGQLRPANQSTARVAPITWNSGFVHTKGTKFAVKDVETAFVGTNAYYLMLRDKISDAEVESFFQVAGHHGLNLVRFFPFVNGYGQMDTGYGGKSTTTPYPLQKSPGVYDEATFQRLDLILAKAAENGIRLIMPLGNFEVELGGIKWWAESVLGAGKDPHLFYTDSSVKNAYKNYVKTILTRTNSINGKKYKEDPTIFSVELLNEPHTQKLYEKDRGLEPGKMVREWIYEMAAYVKSIDQNHMVSTGEEGYRAEGPTDGPYINWLNGGYKGVDFKGNIACPHVDFATLHVYPDSFQIPADNYTWVNDHYIGDRARLAHAAGKPFMVEEYGAKNGYASTRNEVLAAIADAADSHGAAATLVWQVFAWPIVDQYGSYDFDWDQDGTKAIAEQVRQASIKNGKAHANPTEDDAKLQNVNLGTGQSVESRAAQRSLAAASPSGAPEPGDDQNAPSASCSDVRPTRPDGRPSVFDCQQQAAWGKCEEDWMLGFCNKSCGRCGNITSSSASPPSNKQHTFTPVKLP